jgi:hypothetical protein
VVENGPNAPFSFSSSFSSSKDAAKTEDEDEGASSPRHRSARLRIVRWSGPSTQAHDQESRAPFRRRLPGGSINMHPGDESAAREIETPPEAGRLNKD